MASAALRGGGRRHERAMRPPSTARDGCERGGDSMPRDAAASARAGELARELVPVDAFEGLGADRGQAGEALHLVAIGEVAQRRSAVEVAAPGQGRLLEPV